jgi:hypothetical protein
VNAIAPPQIHAIVCLTHQAACLYAEVIQVVETRKIGWFRPLCLKVPLIEADPEAEASAYTLYNLQPGADLLWPFVLFRLAEDTEVIPLLGELQLHHPAKATAIAQARLQLHHFVQQVWEAYPELFRG